MNPNDIDGQVKELAFSRPEERSSLADGICRSAAASGVFPASIEKLYAALKDGRIDPLTVPAINLRGLTYDLARAIWQVVIEKNAGPVIFELAPSEMSAGDQTPHEYAGMVLAAACREGYRGPVFLQGDHFHIDSPHSLLEIQQMCLQAVSAGFYQIDIDAANLIDPEKEEPQAVQAPNAVTTAAMTNFIRSIQPPGIHLTVGGEVGEIGSRNTILPDLKGFMETYLAELQPAAPGLDKISVQTGTRHGGIVLKDGSLAAMPLDLDLAKKLCRAAREDYGICGLVQHGASTLAMAQLAQLAEAGIIEVHLATQVQNIVFDHPSFPQGLLETMRAKLAPSSQGPEGDALQADDDQSDIQKFYHARWSAWGTFKRELWDIPEGDKNAIRLALQEWILKLFTALKIEGKLPAVLDLYRQ